MAELKGESPGVFVSTLERILYQVAAAEGEVAAWQTAVSALRCHVLPDLGNHEARDRAEDLRQQARVLIGEIALWAQARRQFQAEQRSVVLREASQTILATFEMVDLMNVLAQELPRVGIPSCYLSLYEGKDMPSEWSRLMLAYDERGRAELGADGRRVPPPPTGAGMTCCPREAIRYDGPAPLLQGKPIWFCHVRARPTRRCDVYDVARTTEVVH